MRTTFKIILIGIFAILLAVTSSSQSYVKASEKTFPMAVLQALAAKLKSDANQIKSDATILQPMKTHEIISQPMKKNEILLSAVAPSKQNIRLEQQEIRPEQAKTTKLQSDVNQLQSDTNKVLYDVNKFATHPSTTVFNYNEVVGQQPAQQPVSKPATGSNTEGGVMTVYCGTGEIPYKNKVSVKWECLPSTGGTHASEKSVIRFKCLRTAMENFHYSQPPDAAGYIAAKRKCNSGN